MRVAWFQGDCTVPERIGTYSMDEIVAAAEWGDFAPRLRLLLVPDTFDLSKLAGDDWNDAPASCNADEPYERTLPEGAEWVDVRLGDLRPDVLATAALHGLTP